ncbi:MAG: hypothetical protein ABH863_00650 [Candidatus Micrarchaeota archaeon]
MDRVLKAAFTIALLALAMPIAAQDLGYVPGLTDEAGQRSAVLVNSVRWQDAYLVSIYANLEQLPMRYIQDPFQTSDFMNELTTNKLQRVYLFSRADSAVPSLTYMLHSQNLDIRETVFEDHQDLSAKMLEKLASNKVIIVRDDFAFDALSAKYLSMKMQAPVVFSRGPEEMDQRVMQALRAANPSEVFMVGRESAKLNEVLSGFNTVRLQGRDEYDTNNIVNDYLKGQVPFEQGVITTGDIYELALMNIKGQPLFLVPEFGTYSLPRTSGIITDSGINILLGVGKTIAGPGSWLRERTGAKVIIKFATVKTHSQDEGMLQNDVTIDLDGYDLPMPKYDGKIIEIEPAYAEPLGPATGALVQSNRPVAPPVEFRSYFENTGNIDFPAYIILTINDEAGNLITTLQSDRQMVYPNRQNIFRINWQSPPAEGKYAVEGRVFGDVYDGISLPGKNIEFDLSWLIVLLNLLLLLIALLTLAAAIYSSHVLSRDMRAFGVIYKKSLEQFDSLMKYVVNLYHFRGGRKSK